MSQAIDGMAAAARALAAPVVSGNVSLYNETDGEPIYPSPVIGAVGVLEGHAPRPSAGGEVGEFWHCLAPGMTTLQISTAQPIWRRCMASSRVAPPACARG